MNLIIAAVIAVVVVIGGVAVYSKVSNNVLDKQIAEGTADMNVKVAARQAGQTVDEFLEYYGAQDAGLNGKSSLSDFAEALTLGNFAKYQGQEYADFVNEYGLADKEGVSEDMPWKDAEKLIPLGIYIGGAEQLESFKEFYKLDASVTADTPWGDVADAVEAMNEELSKATPQPVEDAEESAAPAEGGEAAPEASAPAAE